MDRGEVPGYEFEVPRGPRHGYGPRHAVGRDYKGKTSVVLYAIAITLSFVSRWIACIIYVVVALMWLIPDPRIERAVNSSDDETAPNQTQAIE